MVAFQDCERGLALNWFEHSKDRRVERAFCAIDHLDSLFPRTLFSPQLELCSTLPLSPRMTSISRRAPLLVPRSLVTQLMALYDYPHPSQRGRIIRGYDRPHAARTARMCQRWRRHWAMEPSGSASIRSPVCCMTWAVQGSIANSLGRFGPGPKRGVFPRGHGNGEPYTKIPATDAKRRPFSGAIEKILRPMALRSLPGRRSRSRCGWDIRAGLPVGCVRFDPPSGRWG